MISIKATDATEVVVTGPVALKQWRERHRLRVPGYQFEPRFKRGDWDGFEETGRWLRLRGEQYELCCSRGLVPRIARDLELPGFDFVGELWRARAATWLAGNAKFAQLRDYQQRAVRRVIEEGWGRVAFATNAGKGAVIALLASFAREHKLPTLILCRELSVFDALQKELYDWGGIDVGLVQRGMKNPPIHRIVLAMVPTLARRLASEKRLRQKKSGVWHEWMRTFQMLLVDEADQATSNSCELVLRTATNSFFRAGFSGSFSSGLYEDVRLDELLGPVIDRVDNVEMVERGVSARPLIEAHSYDATPMVVQNLPPHFVFWRMHAPGRRLHIFNKAIVYNAHRHEFIRSLIQPNELTAIVVNRVEHGQSLQEAIPASVFLDGSVSEAERIRVLEAFARGQVQVIIVTKILDRGSNRLGSAATLIFASGEGSTAQTIQRIGRGLRRAGGKEFLRLVDVVDKVQAGEESDKRLKVAATFLNAAVRKRLQVYADQRFDITIVK